MLGPKQHSPSLEKPQALTPSPKRSPGPGSHAQGWSPPSPRWSALHALALVAGRAVLAGLRLLAKRLLLLPLRPSLQEPPLEGNRLFCRNCLDTWGTSDSAFWGVSGSSFLGDFVASHCSIFWLLSLALSSFLSSKLTGSRHSGVYFQELFTTADGSVLSSVS